jgi:hypothetical protein
LSHCRWFCVDPEEVFEDVLQCLPDHERATPISRVYKVAKQIAETKKTGTITSYSSRITKFAQCCIDGLSAG